MQNEPQRSVPDTKVSQSLRGDQVYWCVSTFRFNPLANPAGLNPSVVIRSIGAILTRNWTVNWHYRLNPSVVIRSIGAKDSAETVALFLFGMSQSLRGDQVYWCCWSPINYWRSAGKSLNPSVVIRSIGAKYFVHYLPFFRRRCLNPSVVIRSIGAILTRNWTVNWHYRLNPSVVIRSIGAKDSAETVALFLFGMSQSLRGDQVYWCCWSPINYWRSAGKSLNPSVVIRSIGAKYFVHYLPFFRRRCLNPSVVIRSIGAPRPKGLTGPRNTGPVSIPPW